MVLFLGGLLNQILPENANKSNKRLILNTLELVEANNFEMVENDSLLERFKNANLKNIFTQSEFEEVKNTLKEEQSLLENKNNELKSKILELVDKNKTK